MNAPGCCNTGIACKGGKPVTVWQWHYLADPWAQPELQHWTACRHSHANIYRGSTLGQPAMCTTSVTLPALSGEAMAKAPC